LPLEEPLLASLDKHGWNRRDAPVFIQSFEQGNLRELRRKTEVRLVQLVSGAAMAEGDRMKGIAEYAAVIGPEKRLIVPVGPDGSLGTPTDFVARAHAAGLLVHVWTIRIDKEFLPAGYQGRPEAEFEQFRLLGVDGVFTDFPDVAAKTYANVRE
jgi:glycerophosphoryl diester phosphodiesterase